MTKKLLAPATVGAVVGWIAASFLWNLLGHAHGLLPALSWPSIIGVSLGTFLGPLVGIVLKYIFWPKVVGAAIGVIVIIALATMLISNNTQERTFYDQAEEYKRFLTEPEAVDAQQQKGTAAEPVEPPVQPEIKPAEPVMLYFKELGEIEKIQAERLLNVAVPGRSISQLPMIDYNLMVGTCREIVRLWPDSWFAYRAKQMLAYMPERYRVRYRVTEEELDISRFTKSRPGTKPFTFKEAR